MDNRFEKLAMNPVVRAGDISSNYKFGDNPFNHSLAVRNRPSIGAFSSNIKSDLRNSAIKNNTKTLTELTGGRSAAEAKGFAQKVSQTKPVEFSIDTKNIKAGLGKAKGAIAGAMEKNPKMTKAITGALLGTAGLLGGRYLGGRLKNMMIKNYLKKNALPLGVTAAGAGLVANEVVN
jgi:hypothetical protein